MIARSLFPRDLFAELNRLQREFQSAQDVSPSIRGVGRGGFPALNLGTTPNTLEVYAFVPGVDPDKVSVEVERGVLVISGERSQEQAPSDNRQTLHLNERFSGRFRRVVSLPDDIDAAAASASYRDGVLRISLPRKQSLQPRRINIA